jgi:hypothetical protein
MNNTQAVAGGRALLRSAAVALAAGLLFTASPSMAQTEVLPGQPGAPYSRMPDLAPIGVRVDRYLPVPEAVLPEAIDPAKGWAETSIWSRTTHTSPCSWYDAGVVVITSLPHIPSISGTLSPRSPTGRSPTLSIAIPNIDHIGGTAGLGGSPIIIAQEDTKRLLVSADDPTGPFRP